MQAIFDFTVRIVGFVTIFVLFAAILIAIYFWIETLLERWHKRHFVVYCKDCKKLDDKYYCPNGGSGLGYKGFCSRGE